MTALDVFLTMLLLTGMILALIGLHLMQAKWMEEVGKPQKREHPAGPFWWLIMILDETGIFLVVDMFRTWDWRQNKSHAITLFSGLGLCALVWLLWSIW